MIDFFWTVGISRYVFIDCENGENSNAEKVFDYLKEKEYISPNTQIFCLIGGDNGNNGWYETFLRKAGKLKIVHNIMPIRIYSVGDNALDNVLSVHLGIVLAHNQNAEFVILAFDHDYNAIEKHFSAAGIKIKIEKLRKTTSPNENQKVSFANDERHTIKSKILKIQKEIRPRAQEKFVKHYHKHLKVSEDCLKQILKDFEKDGTIRIADKNQIEWLK